MIGSLKDWFLALSVRERVLIAVLAGLVVLVVSFYGVARPLYYALDDAETRYVEAVERQARIEAKVAALTVPGDASTKPIVGGLETFVSRTAGETGFAVGKMDTQSDGRINMTIDSAKPTAIFGWLSQLEARGISPEILSATANENGTISANLTLRLNMIE